MVIWFRSTSERQTKPLPSPIGRGAGGEGGGRNGKCVQSRLALTLALSQWERGLVLLLYVLLLTGAAGCGGGPKLFPVSGLVTLDGQPLADAGVLFVPVDKGPAASGTTDAAGKFRLTTTNRSGAIAGHYGVAISKQEVGRRWSAADQADQECTNQMDHPGKVQQSGDFGLDGRGRDPIRKSSRSRSIRTNEFRNHALKEQTMCSNGMICGRCGVLGVLWLPWYWLLPSRRWPPR